MTQGHVTHAEKQGVHVLRYFGAVNFMLAPGLQRFVEHLIHDGNVSGLVFDLTSAESLDSTNLGLMARVNEQLRCSGAANSVIISSNEDIDTVLRSMGFDQMFDLVPADGDGDGNGIADTDGTGDADGNARAEASSEDVPAVVPSSGELRRVMLDAHHALVRMSEAGRLEFEPVVACLERDVSASE